MGIQILMKPTCKLHLNVSIHYTLQDLLVDVLVYEITLTWLFPIPMVSDIAIVSRFVY